MDKSEYEALKSAYSSDAKQNRLQFFRDWYEEDKLIFKSMIQECFVNLLLPKNDEVYYCLIGINRYELFGIPYHSGSSRPRGLKTFEIQSIKPILEEFPNLPVGYDINIYEFNGENIAIIRFGVPKIAKEDPPIFIKCSDHIRLRHRLPVSRKFNYFKGYKAKNSNINELSKDESTVSPVLEEQIQSMSISNTETTLYDANSKIEQLLKIIDEQELSAQEIMKKLGIDVKSRKFYNQNYYRPAEQLNLVEKTIKDKPSSKYQKYRLTQLGKEKLATFEKTSKSLH